MEKHTLLIWNRNPEEIQLFLIPDEVADQYRPFLAEAHGKMINGSDMNPGLEFLNIACNEGLDAGDCSPEYVQYNGCLTAYRWTQTIHIIAANITHVYSSGFFL